MITPPQPPVSVRPPAPPRRLGLRGGLRLFGAGALALLATAGLLLFLYARARGLGLASAGTEPPDRTAWQARLKPLRDFEESEEEWRAKTESSDVPWFRVIDPDGHDVPLQRRPVAQAPGPEDGRHGRYAVELPVRFPGETTLYKTATRIGDCRRITYDVYVPADVPERVRVRALFFLKDKDGLWFQELSPRLVAGRWNTVAVDLRARRTRLAPAGHAAAWAEHLADDVDAIGFKVLGDGAYQGELLFDNLCGETPVGMVSDGPGADGRLALLNFRAPAAPVRRFGRAELTFELNRDFPNPCDPEAVRVDAVFIPPAGDAIPVAGFWYQDYVRELVGEREVLTPRGRPVWKVRFTPRASGAYRYFIEARARRPAAAGDGAETAPGGTPAPPEYEYLTTGERTLAVVEPAAGPGFIRVSESDPRFFEFETGGLFYPVGHNCRSPTDQRSAETIGIPVPPDRGTYSYDRLFEKLVAARENTLEVWMSSWWLALEWTGEWKGYKGVNDYNLANAWRLDYLLAEAERRGLYIHLVIDNHGKYATGNDPEWELNPYRTFGGRRGDGRPVSPKDRDAWSRAARPDREIASPEDFFASPVAAEVYERTLRYLLARYAGSPALLGWEIISELDLVGGGRHQLDNRGELVRNWVRRRAQYLHAHDPYGHPVTVHYSGDYRIIDRRLAADPEIDYITCDGYRRPEIPFPDLARETAITARSIGREGGRLKPVLITEFGGDWNAAEPAILIADLHAGLWSSWMTDAAGTPLFWWFDLVDRRDLYPQYRALANFIEGEERRGSTAQGFMAAGVRASALTAGYAPPSVPEVLVMGRAGSREADVWAARREFVSRWPEAPEKVAPLDDVAVAVPGLAPGRYRVEFWDTLAGAVVNRTELELAARGDLYVPLPPLGLDVALKVRPADVTERSGSQPAISGTAHAPSTDGEPQTAPEATDEAAFQEVPPGRPEPRPRGRPGRPKPPKPTKPPRGR